MARSEQGARYERLSVRKRDVRRVIGEAIEKYGEPIQHKSSNR